MNHVLCACPILNNRKNQSLTTVIGAEDDNVVFSTGVHKYGHVFLPAHSTQEGCGMFEVGHA